MHDYEDYRGRQHKKKKMNELALNQKVDIVHDALVNREFHETIAFKNGISTYQVRYLVRKAKRNKNFFQELRSK